MFVRYAVPLLLEAYFSNAFKISPKAIVSDACASFSTIDELNRQLKPALLDVTQKTDFFSYYRLNLFAEECPFWKDDTGTCGNIACAVNTLDNEEDIPLVWRAEELGKLKGPQVAHPGRKLQQQLDDRPLQGKLGTDVGETCVLENDDECDARNYCVPEDQRAQNNVYVSLVDNPERFTGYSGESARQVWDAIYRENCFQKSSFPKSSSYGTPLVRGPAAFDLKSVMEQHGRQQLLEKHQEHTPNTPFVTESGLEYEDQCLEKRVFHRVISGMHTSISTHLCYEYLNQTTGEWGPNVQCYKDRLHDYAGRVSNLYFNYALVLRAITKLGPSLKDYTFCSGDPVQDSITQTKVQAMLELAGSAPQAFDESLMFANGEGPSLKEDFRSRFRNVSMMMDCVGCDKCRLWGKLQTAGYGAALKVLFEYDNNAAHLPRLKRTELVALFNTLARISDSLTAIEWFRTQVEAEETEAESEGHFHLSDRAAKPHNVVPGKPYSDPDLDAHAAEEDRRRRMRKPQSLNEAFWTELNTVWRVFVFIMKGWVTLPKNL